MDSATDDGEDRSLESLPTELLVYIASFLPTIREKAKLRYVSRKLRSVGEASSLWREFVWPQYDSREEVCVKNLLDVCAHHVKRIGFPDRVSLSGLLNPLSRCYKLTQLSLPSAELDGLSPDQFRNTLQHMEQLERLEIRWNSSINSLLAGSPRLKELTVHAASSQLKWGIVWAHEWVTNKFMPQNLNIVIEVSKYVLIPKLLHAWPLWNSFSLNDCTAELRLFSCHGFKVPLKLFNPLPMFQLHFSQTAMLPFVKAASFGLLGIEPRLLMVTDQNGRTHKAEFLPYHCYNNLVIRDDQLDHHVTTLSFITHFDARNCQSFHPGHLEQLASACPNLQRLDLESKCDCLGSLQGLRTLASCCHFLEGLNLQGIGISQVENCMQLWEILSGMQLTHLAVEMCVLNPFTNIALQQQLSQLFQKFLSLKALECSDGFCGECRSCCEDSLLVCNFPSLVYCKMLQYRGVQGQSNVVQNIINNCEKLECFNVNSANLLSHSSLHNNNSLLQLCIRSNCTILTDDFIKTLSAHGGLVHVVLCVFSVSYSGIITLITNSPKLMTLHVATQHYDEEDEELNLEVTVRKKFCHRKLCTAGSYSFEKKASLVASDTNRLQQNTDLLSFWS